MPSQMYTVQGGRVHVHEQGTGQPVLFIHGHPDSSEMWQGVIDLLPQTYRFLALDLPGYGKSDLPDNFDWSIPNRGKWVADVLDAVGITQPIFVVAHDHGGPFAASFAIQFSQRVQKLVLQNTLFHNDYDWHIFGKFYRTPLVGEYMAFWQRFVLTYPLAVWYMKRSSPLLTNAYIRALQKTWTPQMGRAMLQLYRATTPSLLGDWEQKLYAVIGATPTLVLWGDKDLYLPKRFAESWAAAGAKHISFPEAGHWLAIEKPKEYAGRLAAFFAGEKA